MTKVLPGGYLSGMIGCPPSKSQTHRYLICAALSDAPSVLHCGTLSRDIQATAESLRALGAQIIEKKDALWISPRRAAAGLCRLPCGESGSTLRFLLPVAAALGAEAAFSISPHLAQRPLQPLQEQLASHGVSLRREGGTLYCSGKLRPSGDYTLPGNISSQFISGLLFALPLLPGDSTLTDTGEVESRPYLDLTEAALRRCGISFEKNGTVYHIAGRQSYHITGELTTEGDWSSAAPVLCAGALGGEGITVTGLEAHSLQGDRAITDLLRRFGADVKCEENYVTVRPAQLHGITIDASQIPDLIPAVSVTAALAEGETRIIHARRLRWKESDRLHATAELLHSLGGSAEEESDGLVIHGRTVLDGGTADPHGDHRIAMAAAAAACGCRGAVTLFHAECVEKSYPGFWEDYALLKGGTL